MTTATNKETLTVSNKYKVIFENSPLGFLYFTKDGDIVEYNRKLVDILCASEEDLQNLNIFEVVKDPIVLNIFKNSLHSNTNKYEGYYNSGISGRPFYLRLNINRVLNPDGSVDGAVAMIEDMSSAIESEEKLRISELNFRNLLDNVGEMIIVITDGKPVYVNQELLHRSGYTAEELCSNDFFKFIHPDDMTYLLNNYLSRENGKTISDKYNIRAVTKSGEIRTVELQVNETVFNNKSSLIVVLRDITDMLMMERELVEAKERAEESDKLKSTFLATMSHELRTPLNHVIGFSNLLEEEDINETAKSYSKLIYKSGSKLLSIIEDIYTVIGNKTETSSVCCASATIFELFNNGKRQLQKILFISRKCGHLDLRFRPESQSFGVSLNIDSYKVDLILKNIFSNAVKFTPKGMIEFGYKLNAEKELIFYVSDTGIGIPDTKRDIIFDMFRQVDENMTRNFGGMGLGLSISKRIAESLNGDIYFRNNDNKQGTTFYFKIPIMNNVSCPYTKTEA